MTDEIWITDMGLAQPGDALSSMYCRHHWRLLPYAIKGHEGRMLSVVDEDDPPPVRVPLPGGGAYVAYIGVWNDSHSRRCGVKVRFEGAPHGRAIIPLDRDPQDAAELLVKGIGLNFNRIEDVHLGPVPAGARYLEITPVGRPRSYAGDVAYLRLAPMSKAGTMDAPGERRPLIATEDANSFIAVLGVETEEDIREELEWFRDSDFRAVHWCLFGADLTSYPTRVGTMAGETGDSFLDPDSDRIIRYNRLLADKGINILRVARDWAREIGIEFHISQRTQCFSLYPPFDVYCSSRFFTEHPEWRCVDNDGTMTAQMSYAYEEVRHHLLEVMLEAEELAGGIDGVNLIGARGGPTALFEKPVMESWPNSDGPAEEENEQFLRHRATFFTEYLHSLRRSFKVPISVTVYADRRSNLLYGLDVESWAAEGVVDLLIVYPLGYTDLCHTFEVPLETSFFNDLTRNYGIPWYTFPAPKGSGLKDLILAAREAYQAGAYGLCFWDAAVWMAQRPSTYDVERRLGHLDWVMSVPPEEMPEFHWERFTKLGDFHIGRHAAWMGF